MEICGLCSTMKNVHGSSRDGTTPIRGRHTAPVEKLALALRCLLVLSHDISQHILAMDQKSIGC